MECIRLQDNTPMWIYSSPTDHVSKTIRYTQNYYEYELLSFLMEHFPHQTTILDIGANIGNHSLFFSKYMNSQVISFEPFPLNIDLFRRNLASYPCILYETALSDHSGKMPLYNTDANHFGGFSLHKLPHSFEVFKSVEVRSLDHYPFTDVTLMKIDVEHHENEVLMGAKQTILNHRPVIVLKNSYYYFRHVCPYPEPHREIMEELGYVKQYSNVCHSSMDIWKPA
jgi:FkbM family methyltransferase